MIDLAPGDINTDENCGLRGFKTLEYNLHDTEDFRNLVSCRSELEMAQKASKNSAQVV